jgi:nitrite reductase (NADH) large subunit
VDFPSQVLLENPGESGAARPASLERAEPRGRLVIVGNGMASYKLCERLVSLHGTALYEIFVFGEEPRPAYDRVHLTDFLDGRSADALCLGTREWYSGHGITLRTSTRIASVDREARVVFTGAGESIAYDKLVLATGSRAFVPLMQGSGLSNVFVYRTVEDLLAIRESARAAREAAVIGGGLLGLEAARALQRLGLECHVVEYAPQLLCAQLDPRAGELARSRIENLGIRVQVSARVDRIESGGSRRILHFVDPRQAPLSVDLVVIAAGVRPHHELAEASGLRIAVPGGILVNDRMETSDSRVYAIGECASHRGIIYGLVAPAYRMAEVLAENLMGGSRSFPGADHSTRLKVLGLDVAVLGEYNHGGAVHSWESNGSYRRIVLREGRLVGASAFGEWPQAGQMQDAIFSRRRVWAWQIRRFRKRGMLWPPRKRNVTEWPAASIVCNCMNISCGTLRQARDRGCVTIPSLAEATGASTLCGSCAPLLAELVGAAADTTRPAGRKGLGIAAFAGLLMAVFLIAAPAAPYADSVQSFPYDALWRSGVWKQTTGFTLLSFSLLGLLMSARKRIRHFNRGDFGLWRTFHALMGAATLGILVAHTGMRFGSHLNFALMTFFVLTNLAGAIAGGILSCDRWSAGPWGAVVRRVTTWGHLALTWPLPVLIGFHILAAYYF